MVGRSHQTVEAPWADAAAETLKAPLVTHEPEASGWTAEEVPAIFDEQGQAAEPTAAEAQEAFERAAAMRRPPFLQSTTPSGPSPAFCQHLLASLQLQSLAGLQQVEIPLLLLTIFFFFFTETLLQHIVDCTNARAMETVVVVTENGKKMTRKRQPSDPESLVGRKRIKGWFPLTVAEFLVWIGILIKMGPAGKRRRTNHYWSNLNGLRDDDIKAAMKLQRFLDIYAQLSFMMPNDETSYLGDKLRKIRWVNDYLAERVEAAWVLFQYLAIDESMMKATTRWCPFLQHMPRKPIKLGIKAFVLADSVWNYMFRWRIYTGSTGTDGHSYVYDLIHNELVGDAWFNDRGYIIFMDSFFVMIKLFVALRARGIFAVGPSKAKRPEKKANKDSWPFQSYEKSELQFLPRGWRRVCSQVLAVGGTLHATVWKDNKAVTLLYTAFSSVAKVSVPRWVGSERRRRWVPSFLALRMYAMYMGAVDRIDKTVAYAEIRFGHCAQRYHRVIFFWYLSTIGFHNLSVLFKYLYIAYIGNFKEFYKSKEGSGVGYLTWLQITLATALIQYGVKRAADELPDGETRPQFMPGPLGRPPNPAASAIPETHRYCHGNDIKFYGPNRNATGTLTFSHCKQCYQPVVPAAPGREMQPARRVQTAWGCSKCKVNLCSELCFAAFDHINACQRRELVVQYARVVPGSEVGSPTEPVQAADSPAGPSSAGGGSGGGARRRGRSGGSEGVVEGGTHARANRVHERRSK